MNKLKYIFALLLLTWTWSGCEEVIDLGIDENQSWIAIEGWIYDEPGPYTITISETVPIYSSDSLIPLSNAKVVIRDNMGNVDYLTEEEPGFYLTDSLVGTMFNQYSLEVELPTGETYSSFSPMNRVNPIDTLVQIYQAEDIGFLEAGYYVAFVAQEAPGGPDYYRFKFFKNDSLYDDVNDTFVTDDTFSDGQLAVFQFPFKVDPGDTVRIEIHSLPVEAFDYYSTLQSLINGGGSPFGAPPENVKGNISNGALGFFGASAVASKEIVIQP